MFREIVNCLWKKEDLKMKILYYFRMYDTVMYKWQIENFIDEMSEYGCEIEVFNPLNFTSIDESNEKLIKKILQEKYDMFMTCHNEEILYLDTLRIIKSHGIPTVLFCPDNLLAPFNHEHIASEFDLVWLTSRETKAIFESWGCKTIFLPYAANPKLYKPDYTMEEIERVGFIGNPHGTRMDYINRLVDAGIPLTVHTSNEMTSQHIISSSPQNYIDALKAYIRYPIGRKLLVASIIDKTKRRRLNVENDNLELRERIPFSDMARYSCAYAMMLSFSDAKSTGVLKNPVPIVNLRHFELPMSGALQFTTFSDEIAEYFEDGKEIILCNSKEEYIDKARFWLNSSQVENRKKMKLNARKRAESEHTWKKRFDVLFKEIGIKY